MPDDRNAAFAPAPSPNGRGRAELLPTPQYAERLDLTVELSRPPGIQVVLSEPASPQARLAARLLRQDAESPGPAGTAAMTVRLIEWPGGPSEGVPLNLLDEQVLSPRHHGQGYVLRTLDEHTVAVVGPPLGLLYGAMTLLQLIESAGPDGTLPGVYIRDFPSFTYRVATDWLLNGEGNRWSLDRGRGAEAFEALCRRKLDFCLRYKINMVIFDGFGFGLEQRFAEYPAMMRRLNGYARARGIHLEFGGYGAGFGMAYQPGPLYEDAPLQGTVWMNRTSYPDGPTYACMGYPRTRAGLDPGVFATCRANDQLNRLKGRELADYVRAVEPGALYIHHEDFGGMDTLQRYWLKRCDACRRRWPNDHAAAPDGAAGAVAHGYATLIEAVNSVRNPDTGYDAARDCRIILTSPVYMPSSPSSADWSNALRHWQNVARALPAADNLMVCFRETFPQRTGGLRWVDAFNRAMEDVGRPLGLWVYFAGGADHWLNDYPFVGVPAMNAMFLGAQGIYNASGDAYQEPQQLLNAEYAWNARSDGFWVDPPSHDQAETLWRRLADTDERPAALFGPGGWLERTCRRLYGESAAPFMVRHYSEWLPLRPDSNAPPFRQDAQAGGPPDAPTGFDQVVGVIEDRPYLPMAYEKVYGVPVHWRRLALDARTWHEEIRNEIYAQRFERCGISRVELHARLRRQWELIGQASGRSADWVRQALSAGVPDSVREDLEFLRTSLEVTLPLSGALVEFHQARRLHFDRTSDRAQVVSRLERAAALAEQAAALAQEHFPTVCDPAGAEVGCLRAKLDELRAVIRRNLAAC